VTPPEPTRIAPPRLGSELGDSLEAALALPRSLLRDEKPNFEWLPEAEIKRQGEAAKAGKGNLWKCLNSG